MTQRAVILAAGTASRFGGQKLLAPLNGAPLIAHALAAVAHLPTVLVASPALEPFRGTARFVANAEPERGMTHSLRLANAAIDAGDALLVLLADMPWMTRGIVDAVLAQAGDADVCYPTRDGIGGHPVYFSPRARDRIAALPDGDALKSLRDDPHLVRRTIALEAGGAYRDVDRPGDIGGS